MPELPDVEGFRRTFRRYARDKTVESISADPTIVRNVRPADLGRALKGRTFDDPERHGKWLLCPSDGPWLLIHFGMTGGFVWSHDEPSRHPHDRLTLVFADGELRYRNMRKFGGVWLAHDQADVGEVTGPVGPDAYEIPKKEFIDRISRRRGGLKALLMNQKFVAGLGNLTVDETLWRARLAPMQEVTSLANGERTKLYSAMRRVLRDSIAVGYVPGKRSWLTGARRRDSRCPRCKSPLRRARIAGRTTYWCPLCQPT